MQQSDRAQIDVVGPDLPGFYCPFESRQHPDAETVQVDTIAWARRVELGDNPQHSEIYARTGSFGACLWYPDAPPDRVQSAAQLASWAILVDDLTDSPTPTGRIEHSPAGIFAHLVRITEDPSCALLPGHNVADALVDIVHRLQTWADPTQMRWFSQTVGQWLLGILWEQDVRRNNLPLTLNEYLVPRNWSMANMFAARIGAMLATPTSSELPDHVLDSPAVRAATEAATMIIVFDNDRYSYAKTLLQGDSHIDLFELVRQEHLGISFAEAVVETIALRDRIMNLYVRLRAQLWPEAGSALKQYLTNLECLFSGNIEFGKAARYSTTGTTTLRVTTTPSDNRLDPVPLPSLRWWWDQLDADRGR